MTVAIVRRPFSVEQNGQYTRLLTFLPGDQITPATLPIVTLDVAVIFGR